MFQKQISDVPIEALPCIYIYILSYGQALIFSCEISQNTGNNEYFVTYYFFSLFLGGEKSSNFKKQI
jgi:hypothetical protein